MKGSKLEMKPQQKRKEMKKLVVSTVSQLQSPCQQHFPKLTKRISLNYFIQALCKMYEKILARSFSRYEQRRLGYGALIAFLLVAASFCTVFKPYLGPLPLLNFGMPVDSGLKMLMTQDASKSQNKGNSAADDDGVPLAENRTASQVWQFGNTTVEPDPPDEVGSLPLKAESVSQAGNSTLPPISNKPENVTIFEPVLAGQAENSTMVPEAVDHGVTRSVVKSEVSCNFTLPRSNSCSLTGDVRVSGISGTIFVPQFKPDPLGGNSSKSWKLKPYARKTDKTAMEFVREWSVKAVTEHQELPRCSVNHSVPAIIFSNSGYSGNHFHDSTDTLIPLFLCAKRFNGEVKFLVTNYRISWLNKYRNILKKLSKYEIMDIDKESNTHCFPKVILGLTSQKELDVDPSMPPYSSLKDFTSFIRDAFSLPRSNVVNLSKEKSPKPRLMIISRKATRRLINIRKVVKMAKKVGYEVIVAEGNNTSNLAKFAESMNSCDVLLGVHGAGLTNIVFLPENAVFIQIVPLGLEWLSNFDFGQPARDMNLKYLDYQVTKEESSLIQQYPADHIVFRDPNSFQQQGWLTFRAIYLDKQDIKVDVKRLQPLLVKAIELLHR